jgi:hypothetical protein
MLLCMGLKICLDEDLYRFLAGIHFHSDGCLAKIYLMPTTVLPSNNRMRHFLTPHPEGTASNILLAGHLKNTRCESIVRARCIFSSHAH